MNTQRRKTSLIAFWIIDLCLLALMVSKGQINYESWNVGAIRFGGQLVIHLSWCITGLMPSAQMVSWVCFSLSASTLNIRVWHINITDQFIANRNNTTLLLWTGNFGIAAQFAPFAIPSINSTLKQKTANYSATHQQHDNKATYKQICKSYSQLTNTLSLLGDTATEREDDTLSEMTAPQSSLSLSLFSSPTPFSFFVFCFPSLPIWHATKHADLCTQLSSLSLSLSFCLSVCLSVLSEVLRIDDASEF